MKHTWGTRNGHTPEIVESIKTYLAEHPVNYQGQVDSLLELLYYAYTEYHSVETPEFKAIEYYGAAEPPVRCGVSHLSGLTEPRLIVTQLVQDPDHIPLSWKGLSMDRCSQC